MTRPPNPVGPHDQTPPVARWRWLLRLGVGLSLLVVLAAAFMGWREHRLRQAQAATGAMLVAEGVERQLQDRLQVLAQELEHIAMLDPAASAPGQRLTVPGTARRVVTEPVRVREDGSATAVDGATQPMPALPPRKLDGTPAGLQLLAPQPGARRLRVVWDGTPGVRVVAQVDPEWFVQPLQGRSMEVGTVAALVHDSRRSYASSSPGSGAIGLELASTLFAAENIGRQEGLFEAAGALDGKSKHFVYRRVSGTPLTVVVGSPQVGIGVPAWRSFALTMVLGLLLAVLWTWLLRAYARANARQARLLRRLSAASLVAAQDVTEREADAQRFQLIARATNDAVWDLDLGTDTLWWGDSFYATFGYDRVLMEPTLAAWDVLVHPHDRARVNASLAAAIARPDGEDWQESYRFRHASGEYRQVLDRGFVLRDGDAVATRMLGGMRDVTDERRADERMRLLSRAMDATASGVVIADARRPDHPLVYVNAAFERMTGYASSEILGRNCRFLQGAEHDQVGLEGIRYATREKGEARVLLRNYRKDGTLFWNECFIGPVFDDSGEVSHYIGTQNDVSEHQHYQKELAYRATHDQLTGLPNRQLIKDRLQIAVLAAQARERGVAVVLIDLDDFKLVNDSLDHAAGDEALRVVATRLRGQVLGTNLLGRFGGDEFVLVVADYESEQQVRDLAARLAAAMAEPITLGGIQHVLTMSLGWCVYPGAGYDAETLLKHADIAMFEAKRQGRNRAVQYDPCLNARVSQRLQTIAQLREALEQEQFELAFQPIFDRAGRVTALECLARWQHPVRGLLPPSEFIQVCEESGLITELGRRTLHEAGRHHALLVAAGHGHVRLAVNVSALQFGQDLEKDVVEVMQRFALPEGALELELTESVIMENADSAIDTMRRIAGMGVCLAIDDFGTGYSSLAYLKRLPIDRLKIDRSFVMDLPGDQDAAAVCGSVIALAHSLGVKTVGEGVETDAQLRWLGTHGCDEMQGYLMARPAPFDEILATLEGARAIAHG